MNGYGWRPLTEREHAAAFLGTIDAFVHRLCESIPEAYGRLDSREVRRALALAPSVQQVFGQDLIVEALDRYETGSREQKPPPESEELLRAVA